MISAIEGVVRQIIRNARTTFASYVVDPQTDVVLKRGGELIELSEAPQVILTGFSLTKSQPRPLPPFVFSKNEQAGTAVLRHHPQCYHVCYTIIVAAGKSWDAIRMQEAASMDFQASPTMAVTYGEGGSAFTLTFLRMLTKEFEDRTVGDISGLWEYEGRGQVCDVPVYDEWVGSAKLAHMFKAEIVDGEPDPDDLAKINGDLLEQVQVLA